MGKLASPRTLLIHEHVSGGGLAGQDLPASWLAEGNAMRLALAADFAAVPGLRVVVTQDQRLPEVRGPWQTETIGPDAELDVLDRLAAEADCTIIVAPETGGVLADRARRIRSGWLGSTPEAIALAADKQRLAEHLHKLGVSVPPGRCIEPAAGLPVDTTYPAVLKPIDGAGAIDTFLLQNGDDIPKAARRLPRVLLQPFLAGESLSASFLVDSNGQAHALGVGRQQISRRNGRLHYSGGILPVSGRPRLDEVERAVAAVPGLRGLIGVDFLWESRSCTLTVLEINPRVTTSYVGMAHLLGPGVLAGAWLGAAGYEGDWPSPDLLGILQDRVPIRFWPDGRIETPGTRSRRPMSNR